MILSTILTTFVDEEANNPEKNALKYLRPTLILTEYSWKTRIQQIRPSYNHTTCGQRNVYFYDSCKIDKVDLGFIAWINLIYRPIW